MDDPRLTPAKADVAALYLKGKVTAARFVEGESWRITTDTAPLRDAPRHDAMLQTEALKGERVTVYDRPGEGWAWGQLDSDGYVGWLPEHALGRPGAPPTHKVGVPRTFAFPVPSIKHPPTGTLSLGATVTVVKTEGPFAVTDDGQFLPMIHLAAMDHRAADAVAVAELFLGTPYLWGGKTGLGLDCSGLVQVALTASGIGAPRDSDMQETGLGRTIDALQLNRLVRGDLMFWKGHVAIVRDAATLIHANAHHMATAVEPIRDAVARIKAAGSDITSIKRLA